MAQQALRKRIYCTLPISYFAGICFSSHEILPGPFQVLNEGRFILFICTSTWCVSQVACLVQKRVRLVVLLRTFITWPICIHVLIILSFGYLIFPPTLTKHACYTVSSTPVFLPCARDRARLRLGPAQMRVDRRSPNIKYHLRQWEKEG